MSRVSPLLLCSIFLLLGSSATAQVGGSIVLVELAEAGEIFDPDDGTVVRFPTALSPTHVIYEERNFFGQALGVTRRAGSLAAAPPVVTTRELGPVYFASDGASPFGDLTLFHPTLFPIGSGSGLDGLYVLTDSPTGSVELFFSIGGGLWTHAGSPAALAATGGEGVIGHLRVSDNSHAEGEAVLLFYQGAGGSVRQIQSDPLAIGIDKFLDFDGGTDVEILPATAVPGGVAATGGVFSFPSGDFGLFFVDQSRSFVGYAESTHPTTGWTVTRGAGDPLFSSSANVSAPDGGRTEILELTLFEVGEGIEGYFSGAVPGGAAFSRSLGRVRFENPPAYDPSVPFRRGDANNNDAIDLVDAIFVMQFLFVGGAAPLCVDSADANDDGQVNILDPVNLLEYFFNSGPPPPVPFASCAKDPTYDQLRCLLYDGTCP